MEKRLCMASDCTTKFVPKHSRQLYCSPKCRDREKRRKYARERAKKDLCPQCGKPMDYPVSPHKNKTSPKYCSKCQAYFHERYLKRAKDA